MACIIHHNRYERNHPSLFLQDDACYPGLGDALDLCQQAFSPLGDYQDTEEMGSHTSVILRLTTYGMTEQAIHGRHGAHWVGHPIMRFVHSSHVQRLCGGLSEASKSGRAVALPFITCVLDPLSAITTTFHFVVTPVKAQQDHDGGFYCILFSEQDLGQQQDELLWQGHQHQHQQVTVATFMVLVREAVAWLSTNPFRVMVWLLTLLLFQKKKDA